MGGNEWGWMELCARFEFGTVTKTMKSVIILKYMLCLRICAISLASTSGAHLLHNFVWESSLWMLAFSIISHIVNFAKWCDRMKRRYGKLMINLKYSIFIFFNGVFDDALTWWSKEDLLNAKNLFKHFSINFLIIYLTTCQRIHVSCLFIHKYERFGAKRLYTKADQKFICLYFWPFFVYSSTWEQCTSHGG